jgi:Xaa-Pro aminopeptidase
MLDLQELLIQAAKPGVSAGTLYEISRAFAEKRAYGDAFMGGDSQRIRFIGHGIGLELDELPILAENHEMPLQKGMVIALEPKLVFPQVGVVGIENTHVVTDAGLRRLTEFPDDIVIR